MKKIILVFFILSLVCSNSYSTDKNKTSNDYKLPLVEKIVFTYKINNQKDIYVMNADGSGKAPLINWPTSDEWNPVLSPDGTKLVFFSTKLGTSQLWVSNSDGTNAVQITNSYTMHSGPEWSPDSQFLFFAVNITDINTDIYRVKYDGTGLTAIRNASCYEYEPAIDPVLGRYLVYKYDPGYWGPTAISKRFDLITNNEITLINSFTDSTYGCHELRYSPDNNKIVFSRDIGTGYPTYGGPCNIYIMNADATGWHKLTNLTGNGQFYIHPTWSPNGSKLIFTYEYPSDQFHDSLFILNSDGTGGLTVINIGLGGSAIEPYWGRYQPVGVKRISSNIPVEYQLYQNYPNPFNPITKIKFSIPASPVPSKGGGQVVSLIIYDILGREIASLIPPLWGGHLPAERSQAGEGLSPGTYEVEWNAGNFPSGVYFYRLTILNPETSSGLYFNETKKLILLK